jgi:roadblock/LC7 domain-containing protein
MVKKLSMVITVIAMTVLLMVSAAAAFGSATASLSYQQQQQRHRSTTAFSSDVRTSLSRSRSSPHVLRTKAWYGAQAAAGRVTASSQLHLSKEPPSSSSSTLEGDDEEDEKRRKLEEQEQAAITTILPDVIAIQAPQPSLLESLLPSYKKRAIERAARRAERKGSALFRQLGLQTSSTYEDLTAKYSYLLEKYSDDEAKLAHFAVVKQSISDWEFQQRVSGAIKPDADLVKYQAKLDKEAAEKTSSAVASRKRKEAANTFASDLAGTGGTFTRMIQPPDKAWMLYIGKYYVALIAACFYVPKVARSALTLGK